MTFSDDLRKFSLKAEFKTQEAFVEATNLVNQSVVDGLELTGSKGQPVGQYGPGYHPGEVGGYLKSSFIPRFLSKWSWIIETDAPYAKSIEDGLSYAHGGTPMTLRSSVGGFYSVAKTVAGWGKIVEVAGGTVVE